MAQNRADNVYLTLEQLEERCAYWQGVMRLQDWRVALSIKRLRDFETEREGEVEYYLTDKKAIIRLVDPVDDLPDHPWPLDQEITLVHELVHLHLTEWNAKTGTPEYHAKEIAINMIASALVTLERERQALEEKA